jgi:hypothetical protein
VLYAFRHDVHLSRADIHRTVPEFYP